MTLSDKIQKDSELEYHFLLKSDVKEFIRLIREDMKGLNGELALNLILKNRAGDELSK